MPFYKYTLIAVFGLLGSLAVAAEDTGMTGMDGNNKSSDHMTSDTTPMSDSQATSDMSGAKGNHMQDNKTAADEQSGFSRGSVVRSVFTSAVDEREPVDKLKNLNTEQSNLVYFTELRDMAGQTAKHRWQYNGEVVAEVDFNVRGPRWRVWSSKALNPAKEGEWKVSVLNGAGDVIAEEIIQAAADASMSNTMPKSSSEQSTMMNEKKGGVDGVGIKEEPMSPAMMNGQQ